MKRELIVTIIIVIIIIISGILTQENTKKTMSDINSRLQNFKEDVLEDKKQNNELFEDVNQLYDYWMEKDKILSLYIEHNELEKINTHLMTIKGYIEAEDVKESISEIEKCISVVEHLEEKQAVNIKNIF